MPDEDEAKSGWLPPQPPGPEPDIGQPPATSPPPPPAPAAQPQQQPPQPPPPPPTAGYQQPQQHPGYYQQPYTQMRPPGNGKGVGGFVVGIVSAGLLHLDHRACLLPLAPRCGGRFAPLAQRGTRPSTQGGPRNIEAFPKQDSSSVSQCSCGSIIAGAGWIIALDQNPDVLDDLDEELNDSVVLALPRIAFALLAGLVGHLVSGA